MSIIDKEWGRGGGIDLAGWRQMVSTPVGRGGSFPPAESLIVIVCASRVSHYLPSAEKKERRVKTLEEKSKIKKLADR